MLPYVPIADRVRIGVAMFSYRDTLTFGITADYDTTPDLQVLADGIGRRRWRSWSGGRRAQRDARVRCVDAADVVPARRRPARTT